MKPQKINNTQSELFMNRLSNLLNPKDALCILASQINWAAFEEAFAEHYVDGPGQPPKAIRLMVGLMMLQHMHGLSDEQVVQQWVHNPYWQYFCGYDYLQWELPADGSSLTRWRGRLGEEGLEKILAETVVTAVKTKTVAAQDLKRVIVDTTVMEKNIRFPTDSQLLNKAREKLVSMAKKYGVALRQTYVRVGATAALKAARYAHAKQFKRMKQQVKALKNYLGRTVREVERKITQVTQASAVQKKFAELLAMANRLLLQKKDSKDKLYSLHAPEAYCIAKGKVGKPYEFGCKVSLVLTHKQGLALSSQALHENQYDGHSLNRSLQKAEAIAKAEIDQAFVDKGYKGHDSKEKQVYIAGQKRGMTKVLKKHLKRRSAIEPHIGHMKSEGKLRRNYLKGSIGDSLNALLCAIGHNLRMIWRKIRDFFIYLLACLFNFFTVRDQLKSALLLN